MAESFRCIVATPTRELFNGDIYYADVPGYAGHYGVLNGHESLVATNHQGGKLVLHLDPDGNEKKVFLIHRGCSQMLHNHLSVLGRFGCDPETIDVEKVLVKAEKLAAEIEEHKQALDTIDDEDKLSAEKAWIITEEIHHSWYEAQIEFAETGKESTKQ